MFNPCPSGKTPLHTDDSENSFYPNDYFSLFGTHSQELACTIIPQTTVKQKPSGVMFGIRWQIYGIMIAKYYELVFFVFCPGMSWVMDDARDQVHAE